MMVIGWYLFRSASCTKHWMAIWAARPAPGGHSTKSTRRPTVHTRWRFGANHSKSLGGPAA
eukprot:13343570-Alexandrium_andersonii.AAC.1